MLRKLRWIKLTFDTSRRRVFERIHGQGNTRRARGSAGDVTDLGCTLTEVGPLVRGRVGEAVGHGTVRAVDDTRATRMFDARNGLLVGVDHLGEGTRRLVSGGLTEDLQSL